MKPTASVSLDMADLASLYVTQSVSGADRLCEGDRMSHPKSQILRSQLAFSSKFDGLRSRCRTLRSESIACQLQ